MQHWPKCKSMAQYRNANCDLRHCPALSLIICELMVMLACNHNFPILKCYLDPIPDLLNNYYV